MIHKAVLLLVAVLAAGLLSGCASRSLTSANAGGVQLELQPQDYQVIASTQGKHCTVRVLGLTFNNPDLLLAEIDAMSRAAGGNLLVNKHVYQQDETIIPFFFGNVCYYVEGIAVRLD